MSKVRQLFVHVAYGRDSFPLGQRCNMLCTSGFVEIVDVIFFHNRPYGARDASRV